MGSRDSIMEERDQKTQEKGGTKGDVSGPGHKASIIRQSLSVKAVTE